MVYCYKCGKKNEDDADYCIKCGVFLAKISSFEENLEKFAEEIGRKAEQFGKRVEKKVKEFAKTIIEESHLETKHCPYCKVDINYNANYGLYTYPYNPDQPNTFSPISKNISLLVVYNIDSDKLKGVMEITGAVDVVKMYGNNVGIRFSYKRIFTL